MAERHDLVEEIFSAAVEPERWPAVLHRVRKALDLTALNLIFLDSGTDRPPTMLESGHDPASVSAWGPRAAENPNLVAVW